MYRLALYYLAFLIAAAVALSFFGALPYSPLAIIVSTLIIIIFCLAANNVFAYVFEAPSNIESVIITALILALIISPPAPLHNLAFLGWASILAMASKYILAINKKHIFNPAAIAVAITALAISQTASWWVGNLYMAPFVFLGGLMVVRKIQREDMFAAFLIAAFATILGSNFLKGQDLIATAKTVLFYTPVLFFSCIMLTEPMTTPPKKNLRIWYGLLVGFLFAPAIHIGSVYSTPELALLAGNIFSYIVSPKEKLVLKLKEKIKIAPDAYDFIFQPDRQLAFAPGQYMEWTLGHEHQDNRGMRRFFTIASSPTEKNIRMGIKFYDNSSSFKKSLLAMKNGASIVASQLAGDFVLPKNPNQKLVLMAGGIGITPFRSMIKNLSDNNTKRSLTLIYSNKTEKDIVYKEIFDEAEKKLGIKVIYNVTEKNGRVDGQMIAKNIPDYMERMFYLSGPHGMVDGFEEILLKLGVAKKQIKKDFFPGFV